MKYVLHILNKALNNEKAWLSKAHLGAIDAKYREGARMAKERIPQLEQAINILKGNVQPVTVVPETKTPVKAEVIKRKTVSLFSVFKKKI